MTQTTKRIEFIDLAKFFAIFFVILSHTVGNTDYPLYREIIITFPIQLFFILAGMVQKPVAFEKPSDFGAFLVKNVKALVVPFFIWAIIYSSFSYSTLPLAAYGSWEALTKMGTLTSLWYLAAFFLGKVFSMLVWTLAAKIRHINVKITSSVISVALLLVGFYLPIPELGMPWCFNQSLIAVFFIIFGMNIRDLLVRFQEARSIWLFLAFAGTLALFCLGTVARGDEIEVSLMAASEFGSLGFFVLNSFTGSFTCIFLAMFLLNSFKVLGKLSRTKFVRYAGTHTMGIYIIHKPFLQQVIMPGLNTAASGVLPLFPIALIGTVIALVCSVPITMLIDKYIPQLFGRFPIRK